MNKLIYIIFIFILSCSLNSNSAFWSKSEKLKTDKKISKILFQDLKPNENEFNPKLKVNLPIKNTSINYNFNNSFTFLYYDNDKLKKSAKLNFKSIGSFIKFYI